MRRYVALACAVLLTGCSYSTVFQNPSGIVVRAGMTKDEVRAAWGEPQKLGSTPEWADFLLTTDVWQYDFATVYFIQRNIVEKIAPKGAHTTQRGLTPQVNQAGGGARR